MSSFEELVLGGGGESVQRQSNKKKEEIPAFLMEDDDNNNNNTRSGGGGGGGQQGRGGSAFLSSLDAFEASGSGGGCGVVMGASGTASGVFSPSKNTVDNNNMASPSAAAVSSAERLYFCTTRPSTTSASSSSSPPPHPTAAGGRIVYNLKRVKILGKGNFGCATHYTNEGAAGSPAAPVRNASVVVKDVNLQAMASERASEVAALINEVRMLTEVKGHPNCLHMFDCFSSSSLNNESGDGAAAGGKKKGGCGSSSGSGSSRGLAELERTLCDRETKMFYLLTEHCGGGDLSGKVDEQLSRHNTLSSGANNNITTTTGKDMALCNEHKPAHFSEAFVASITIQLLMGLNFLHADKKIIHRDIKPQNIFLREDGVSLRIGDFGIAFSELLSSSTDTAAASSSSAGRSRNKEVKGTPFYMAPELFSERSRYSFTVDVWSAGVMLYELIALERPFLASSYQDLSRRVLENRCTPLREREALKLGFNKLLKEDEYIYSKELLDLVMEMLVVDPALRPNARRLLKKRYVRQHLHTVPREVLLSAPYREFFQRECDIDVRSIAAAGAMLFGGLPEVQDEDPVRGGAGAGEEEEEEDAYEDDFEDAYEDDFESDGDE